MEHIDRPILLKVSLHAQKVEQHNNIILQLPRVIFLNMAI